MDIKEIINNNVIIITGGIGTTLIYKYNIQLQDFSSINLLKDYKKKEIIKKIYTEFIELAKKYNIYLIVDTFSWRLNKDWIIKSDNKYSELDFFNKESVKIATDLKNIYDKIIVNGEIGPRYEGYYIKNKIDIEESKNYHIEQIKVFKGIVDTITAVLMNHISETLGIVLAAKEVGIPIIVSFTLDINNKLPSGETVEEAITKIDNDTEKYVICYIFNCVNPKYILDFFKENKNKKWIERIKGIKPNASVKTHEELDKLNELDTGDIDLLSNNCGEIKKICKNVNIFGGCCGTNVEHTEKIYKTVIKEHKI